MKANLVITKEGTEHEIKFCNDPAFYTWTGNDLVATVALGDKRIGVYCDGEMRIHLWDTAQDKQSGKNYQSVIRYCNELKEYGITTDKELQAQENRIEWINNSWYDLYDLNSGEHLDCVHYDIDEAILQASAILEDGYQI